MPWQTLKKKKKKNRVRTLFKTRNSRTCQTESMKLCRAKTCALHLWPNVHTKTGQWMKKKNKNKNQSSRISEALWNFCTLLFAWTILLTTLKLNILWSCSPKNSKTFKDQNPISSTFKALKSDSWNSRAFKTRTNPEQRSFFFTQYGLKENLSNAF